MKYTVNQVARLSGVSVRTLHFYDEKGLLSPSFVGKNGYRYYEENKLALLQEILFFRELEFSLEQIKEILSSPSYSRGEALKAQKRLLLAKKIRLEKLIETIDKEQKGGGCVNTKNMFGSFSVAQIDEYREEAKRRWGDSEAYKQSAERTKNWKKEDYKRVAEEGKKFTQLLADTMEKGAKSHEFQELVAKHHESIEVFYDCPLEMYKCLGDMYVEDSRFTQYYDDFKPGLAKVLRDGIVYYCDRNK